MYICIHMHIHVYSLNIYIANLVNKQEDIKRLSMIMWYNNNK
jgi:hypothetical protein